MGRETLFLAVNCVDRFLATTKISQDCFQLLGIAALWVTAKLVCDLYQNIYIM